MTQTILPHQNARIPRITRPPESFSNRRDTPCPPFQAQTPPVMRHGQPKMRCPLQHEADLYHFGIVSPVKMIKLLRPCRLGAHPFSVVELGTGLKCCAQIPSRSLTTPAVIRNCPCGGPLPVDVAVLSQVSIQGPCDTFFFSPFHSGIVTLAAKAVAAVTRLVTGKLRLSEVSCRTGYLRFLMGESSDHFPTVELKYFFLDNI
jgi:hypothetical protein